MKAVAIGGGTGLPIVLKSLRDVVDDVTAIVCMADDGGSSGRLRHELGIQPPGDIRNCLVALADPDNDLVPVFQYRFTGGPTLADHNLGNLIIAGLTGFTGDFLKGIEAAGRLLKIKGHVYPSTADDIILKATLLDGTEITGQAKIARTEGIRRVTIEPSEAAAYPPAVKSIEEADIVVIGPGSLFTSIIPNLLVPGIASAIGRSRARKIFVLNTLNQRRETLRFTMSDYVNAINQHASASVFDLMLANIQRDIKIGMRVDDDISVIRYDKHKCSGVDIRMADLMDRRQPLRHDPERLATFFQEFLREV